MARPKQDVLHCPHCLRELTPPGHFCTACGMPVSSYSTIGPMEQVWSMGFLVSRLLDRRPTLLAVLGTWGLALPALLGLLGVAMSSIIAVGDGHGSAVPTVMAVIPGAVLFGCYLLLACRVTLAWLRQPPRDQPGGEPEPD